MTPIKISDHERSLLLMFALGFYLLGERNENEDTIESFDCFLDFDEVRMKGRNQISRRSWTL